MKSGAWTAMMTKEVVRCAESGIVSGVVCSRVRYLMLLLLACVTRTKYSVRANATKNPVIPSDRMKSVDVTGWNGRRTGLATIAWVWRRGPR